MYHKSIYNYIYKKDENEWVIFNTLNGSIVVIDDNMKNRFDKLNSNKIELSDDFIKALAEQGIIVNNKYDEKQLVDASRARRTYNEKAAYIRILTTTGCNAKCEYCYEKGFKPETMNEKTALAVADFILNMPKLDKIYIHWFGGEPLLNTKVIDLIMEKIYNKLIKNNTNIFVYFTSNGSLLTKDLVRRARQLWHTNQFQITIDDIGEKYDNIKKYVSNKYNYERVIKNIGLLLNEGIKVILRINYYKNEVDKVKKVIDTISEQFLDYCKKGLLFFDPAPIFEIGNYSCTNCGKVYNMTEPIKYLIEKGLISLESAFDLKFKSGQCYACHQGSFVISPSGDLYKCTVTMKDKEAVVGNIFDGIDRNKYYFKWVNPNLPQKCNNCVFLPLCQGGCRAGELKYMSVFCKRNLAEINDILDYKVNSILSKKIKLVPFKELIGKDLYNMYQDIPENEVGSSNLLKGLTYKEFQNKVKEIVKEETIINEKLNTTTKKYILVDDKKLIGEVGIRTTLNDFWINKGSQIFYKIRLSKRNKGYGNIILKLALEEARKLGFKQIRINCDDKNIRSKKVILKNGGKPDIISYKTNDGTSTSYLIEIKE